MLLGQSETLGPQERRGIDQRLRRDSRGDAEENIHGSQPSPRTDSRHPLVRNAKICQQPVGLVRRDARELFYHFAQLLFSEAIETEMRYDQIVALFGRSPQHDVLVEEADLLRAVRQFARNPLPRQSKHSLTRIEAIDLHLRVQPQQFAQKPSIPLTHDKRMPWRRDLGQTSNATALEIFTERDPLQRSVPRCDKVEAHAFITNSARNGVSSTRSASAVL